MLRTRGEYEFPRILLHASRRSLSHISGPSLSSLYCSVLGPLFFLDLDNHMMPLHQPSLAGPPKSPSLESTLSLSMKSPHPTHFSVVHPGPTQHVPNRIH